MIEESSRFFENKKCEYYPCHKMDEINCLFCYCPLYRLEKCPGNHTWVETRDGRKVKSCMDCTFPHKPENYDAIMGILKQV